MYYWPRQVINSEQNEVGQFTSATNQIRRSFQNVQNSFDHGILRHDEKMLFFYPTNKQNIDKDSKFSTTIYSNCSITNIFKSQTVHTNPIFQQHSKIAYFEPEPRNRSRRRISKKKSTSTYQFITLYRLTFFSLAYVKKCVHSIPTHRTLKSRHLPYHSHPHTFSSVIRG